MSQASALLSHPEPRFGARGVRDHTHLKGARLAELGGFPSQLLPIGVSLGQEESSVSPHLYIYQNLGHPQQYFYFKCCPFCEL